MCGSDWDIQETISSLVCRFTEPKINLWKIEENPHLQYILIYIWNSSWDIQETISPKVHSIWDETDENQEN